MSVFSKLMPSKPLGRLVQRTSIAEALRTLCEQNAEMKLLQPIAASAAEDQRSTTASLAAYAVDKVALVITPDAILQPSPAQRQGLDSLEKTLDSIRRHIENLPQTQTQLLNPKTRLNLDRTFNQLKAELNGHLNTITSQVLRGNEVVLANSTQITALAVTVRNYKGQVNRTLTSDVRKRQLQGLANGSALHIVHVGKSNVDSEFSIEANPANGWKLQHLWNIFEPAARINMGDLPLRL
ncbi:hypothetical protein C8R43DRAFT_943011 [Mycena crocata]|nr:hypothetical protein C8R43DRAFT_943011 [Mycena crocata]